MRTLVNIITLLLIGAAILGGLFWVVIGLTSLDNSITVAASAAMGSAFFVFAILLIVARGLDSLNRRAEAQQKVLLYLATQRNKREE